MKKTLSIVSKAFQTAMEAIPLTQLVTMEFCYDHVLEDDPTLNSSESTLPQPDVLQLLAIQENK